MRTLSRSFLILTAASSIYACSGEDDPPPPAAPAHSVELDFASGSEVFMLSVFSTPGTNAESANQGVTYSLKNGAAASSGALRVAQLHGAGLSPYEEQFWRERIAFEQARRDGIDRLVAELEASGRTLQRTDALTSTCSPACASGQVCWKGSCTNAPQVKLGSQTFTCDVVGRIDDGNISVDILVDQADTATSDALMTRIAEDFATAGKTVLDLLGRSGGHISPIDRDGSGAVTVVFSDKLSSLGASIVGGFFYTDMLATGTTGATGNEADILWARVPSDVTQADCAGMGGCDDEITDELAISTLAHEYQHLVNFAVRSANGANPEQLREVLWLDEGMAHAVEDLTGWGSSNVAAVLIALQNWPDAGFATTDDSVEQRGQSYLLLRYMIDKAAKAAGASTAGSTQVLAAAKTLFTGFLDPTKAGFRHAAFSDRGTLIPEWLSAVVGTGITPALPAALASKFLPTATHGTSGLPVGIAPYGESVTARGAAITLEGPQIGDGSEEELTTDLSTPFESTVNLSGSHYFRITAAAAGKVTIELDAPENVDLGISALRLE